MSADHFLNRELGWLEFNHRVLHEAKDPRTPLLERVRFLAIFNSNLDEFYMKRVGGLKRQQIVGFGSRSIDGMTVTQRLKSIRKKIIVQQKEASDIFKDLKVSLEEQGIFLLNWSQLGEQEKRVANEYFKKNVFPILTPLAVDPGHPFPFISNLSTSLGVTLSHPDRDEHLFTRIKVPKVLPQWIQLNTDDNEYRFVRLRDIVVANVASLFPSMEIVKVMPFRVTRNADVERDEEGAEDLLEMIEEELKQRRFAEVVRIESLPGADSWMMDFLSNELELSDYDLYQLEEELDFTDLGAIADLDIPEFKFDPWVPILPKSLAEEGSDIFSAIRTQDILVHHPYESYAASVERFVQEAASDPKVLAIKMTLYRTGDHSPIVRSLIQAAEKGKQVVCLIELKARFDEERNIYWAQELENAGIHVVYGIVGLKTHSKLALVVRQESDQMRCYTHIGTGNYNSSTARLYTDLGIFTANREVTEEVVELFHYLTGRSLKSNYKNLLVAPVNMAAKFLEKIEIEIENAKNGKPAAIIAKCNSLEDAEIIRALYRASNAGVKVDLIIRGFCCLKPGMKDLSENIRVISVIGRFLEHSRIFYFRGGAESDKLGEFYMGSADWMSRNLHARVEAIVPILNKTLKEKLWVVLQVMLHDRRQAWTMQPDGTYLQETPENDQQLGSHKKLMEVIRKINDPTEDQAWISF